MGRKIAIKNQSSNLRSNKVQAPLASTTMWTLYVCMCVCVSVCLGGGGVWQNIKISFLWIQDILCMKCKYNALVVYGLHVLHIFLEPLVYIFDREYYGLKTLQKWCNSGVCILIKWDTRYFSGAYSWTWIPDGMVLAKPIVHARERGKLFLPTVVFSP